MSCLVACSGQPEYLQATSLPALKLPEGKDGQRLGQRYPVPDSSNSAPSRFNVPFPPTLGVQSDTNIASVQTMGDKIWVLNAKKAATTWSQLIVFFNQKNIPLLQQNITTATILTGVFTEASQPGVKLQYQLRLEQGFQAAETEIILSNRSIGHEDELISDFQHQGLQDPIHGDWFAKELVASLNNRQELLGDSLLATSINLPVKLRLRTVDGESVLSVVAPEARLQRALTKALSGNGFTLYEQDVQSRVFYFNQNTVSTKQFRWYQPFSWGGSAEPKQKRVHRLETILASLANEPQVNTVFTRVVRDHSVNTNTNTNTKTNNTKKFSSKQSSGYLLVYRDSDNEHLVFVRDLNGLRINDTKSRELLDAIRLRLI